jgi:lysophospholipase L1-like esterase
MRDSVVLVASIAAALVLSEAVLSWVVPHGPYPFVPGLEVAFQPDPELMPGVSGVSRFAVNADGLRGDEPFGEARILAIGGSTTESLYLDQSEAWPQMVQDSLGVWVGNAGKSGLTTRHHVVYAESLLDKHQPTTVLVLAGVNDLTRRLSADDEWAPADLSDVATRAGVIRESFVAHPDFDAERPYLKRTELWRLAAQIRVGSAANADTAQDASGQIYATWREHRQQATAIRDELPDLTEALAEYESNLHAIIDGIERAGAEAVLMTQPVLWRSGLSADLQKLLWLGGVGDFQAEPGHDYYSVEALQSGMERYNAVLLEVCEERELSCLDLAALVPQDGSMYYDDVHFSEAGSRRVAEVVAEHLR